MSEKQTKKTAEIDLEFELELLEFDDEMLSLLNKQYQRLKKNSKYTSMERLISKKHSNYNFNHKITFNKEKDCFELIKQDV